MNQIEEPGINGVGVSQVFKNEQPPDGWVVCNTCDYDDFNVGDQIVARKYLQNSNMTSNDQLILDKFTTISEIINPDITLDYGSITQSVVTIYPPNWEILKYTPSNTT